MSKEFSTLSDVQYILPTGFSGFRILNTGEKIRLGDRALVLANDGELPEWHFAAKKFIGKPYLPRHMGTIIIRPFRISASIID